MYIHIYIEREKGRELSGCDKGRMEGGREKGRGYVLLLVVVGPECTHPCHAVQ